MIDTQKYENLKKQQAQMEKQKQQLTGSIKELKKELGELFGCSSVEEAEQLAEKLLEEVEVCEREYNKQFEAFKEKRNL